ncbi:heterochromatin protein 1-like isoform X2 [Teleopsis dalmanni]|uniref:heterochromatin protein 1-like isoform X2 n=1 Tax=Teleopsis dalmanni TaxID=139649 RepID=UPI0018CE2E16|nr:heterochromatin protein 1-like isoform X2 [Teleopsis dalmanni]
MPKRKYIVEEIRAARFVKGKKGTWEPAESLQEDIADDVAEFERKYANNPFINGFASKYKLEKIVSILQIHGDIYFAVKFAGHDKLYVLHSATLNKHAPQMVIKFYEQRIQFRNV